MSSLYQISPSNQVIRKRKYERGNSDEDPLLKKRNYLTTFTKYEEFTQGHCKPELYNCLVEADTTVTYGATKVVDNKENYIKSPRRNRFVVRSPSKKHKFDLNAPKEVVTSRYVVIEIMKPAFHVLLSLIIKVSVNQVCTKICGWQRFSNSISSLKIYKNLLP